MKCIIIIKLYKYVIYVTSWVAIINYLNCMRLQCQPFFHIPELSHFITKYIHIWWSFYTFLICLLLQNSYRKYVITGWKCFFLSFQYLYKYNLPKSYCLWINREVNNVQNNNIYNASGNKIFLFSSISAIDIP